MIRDPIITRWIEAGDRNPGLLAIKLSKTKELVVSDYSERGQAKLIEAFNGRETRRKATEKEKRALRKRPPLIEGD